MQEKRNSALVPLVTRTLSRRLEPQDAYLTPVSDIFETPDAFVLRLEMPGSQKELMQLYVDPRRMIIKGPITPYSKGAPKLIVNEIVSKMYYRAFNLTSGLDLDRIEAEFEDGILTITIPKTDALKTRTIPIL